MRFWDSSALVPLIVDEPQSTAMRQLLNDDPHVLVWQLTEVEVLSALARHHRADPAFALDEAEERLTELSASWVSEEDAATVARAAKRLLRIHQLRAADALQLGAAIVIAGPRRTALPFVTLDRRLASAAAAEGFATLP